MKYTAYLLFLLLLKTGDLFSQSFPADTCCADSVHLISPLHDLNNVQLHLRAKQKITAENKIINNAKVIYQSKTIVLKTGFFADLGSVFEAKGFLIPTNRAIMDILDKYTPSYPAYCIDSKTGLYAKDQRIIRMNDSISTAQISIQTDSAIASLLSKHPSLGSIIVKKICNCDPHLQLWEANGIHTLNDSTIIKDGGRVSNRSVRIKDANFNYFTSTAISDNGIDSPAKFPLNAPQPPINAGFFPPSDSAIVVAYLDTGIDFLHPKFDRIFNNGLFTFWQNNPEILGGASPLDEDNDNLINDFYGWNFVLNNNNPYDDIPIKHGSNVIGSSLSKLQTISPRTKIIAMVLKTHDQRGIGLLSDIICAMIYAKCKNANLVNASFAYEGLKSSIFQKVIDDLGTTQPIMLLAAAGNEGKIINDIYPACFSSIMPHVVSVTGLQDSLAVCGELNYSPIFVDAGVNMTSSCMIPSYLDTAPLTGTSYATPILTAWAARYYSASLILGNGMSINNKNNFLIPVWTRRNPQLNPFIRDGVFINR